MQVQDLGGLEGPVLLFGGPYSNLQATRALFDWAQEMGFGPRNVICTGDVVAYCANPVETVAEIRKSGCAVVAGNCEQQLAANAMGCGCGFEAGSACDLLSAGWYAHADVHVGADDRAWMAVLPDMVVFTQKGRRFAVIHGGLSDVSRFLWSTSPEAAFAAEVALIRDAIGPVDAVIAGHSGIPFVRQVAGVEWTNAGVIGMPPNDGRPQMHFATLCAEGQVQLREMPYDHRTARAAMEQAGLTQGYHAALETGYWPSEDVLPPVLRRAALASG